MEIADVLEVYASFRDMIIASRKSALRPARLVLEDLSIRVLLQLGVID
jgi:hypothetical protein